MFYVTNVSKSKIECFNDADNSIKIFNLKSLIKEFEKGNTFGVLKEKDGYGLVVINKSFLSYTDNDIEYFSFLNKDTGKLKDSYTDNIRYYYLITSGNNYKIRSILTLDDLSIESSGLLCFHIKESNKSRTSLVEVLRPLSKKLNKVNDRVDRFVSVSPYCLLIDNEWYIYFGSQRSNYAVLTKLFNLFNDENLEVLTI